MAAKRGSAPSGAYVRRLERLAEDLVKRLSALQAEHHALMRDHGELLMKHGRLREARLRRERVVGRG